MDARHTIDDHKSSPWAFGELKSEYDQEIPQSHTAEQPMTPQGRATEQSQDTRKTVKVKQQALSSPSRWLQN